MANLIMMTRKKKTQAPNGKYYRSSNYTNQNAVANLIRYITRTRVNEDRQADLLGYGAMGVFSFLSPEDMITEIQYVQTVYGINQRKGRRMYHETFNLCDDEVKTSKWKMNAEELVTIGYECARYYYDAGYQVVFAVHYEPSKHYHIHFAVSTINFINGRKWHTTKNEIELREKLFNEILCKHQLAARGCISPIYFFDDQPSEEDMVPVYKEEVPLYKEAYIESEVPII